MSDSRKRADDSAEKALAECIKAFQAGAGGKFKNGVIGRLKNAARDNFEKNKEKWPNAADKVILAARFSGRIARISAGMQTIDWEHVAIGIRHANEICTEAGSRDVWCPDI